MKKSTYLLVFLFVIAFLLTSYSLAPFGFILFLLLNFSALVALTAAIWWKGNFEERFKKAAKFCAFVAILAFLAGYFYQNWEVML